MQKKIIIIWLVLILYIKEANLCSTKIYYEKPDTNESKHFE